VPFWSGRRDYGAWSRDSWAHCWRRRLLGCKEGRLACVVAELDCVSARQRQHRGFTASARSKPGDSAARKPTTASLWSLPRPPRRCTSTWGDGLGAPQAFPLQWSWRRDSFPLSFSFRGCWMLPAVVPVTMASVAGVAASAAAVTR